MVVIGGMGSVSGAVIGAVFVIGIPAIAPDNQLLGLLSSSLGLLIVLMYFPRGLNQITFDGTRCHLGLGRQACSGKKVGPAPAYRSEGAADAEARPVAEGLPVLAVSGVTVTFGGLTAVNGASLRVDSGEIVGLIGANGAGKSTLMNAIGGSFRPPVR